MSCAPPTRAQGAHGLTRALEATPRACVRRGVRAQIRRGPPTDIQHGLPRGARRDRSAGHASATARRLVRSIQGRRASACTSTRAASALGEGYTDPARTSSTVTSYDGPFLPRRCTDERTATTSTGVRTSSTGARSSGSRSIGLRHGPCDENDEPRLRASVESEHSRRGTTTRAPSAARVTLSASRSNACAASGAPPRSPGRRAASARRPVGVVGVVGVRVELARRRRGRGTGSSRAQTHRAVAAYVEARHKVLRARARNTRARRARRRPRTARARRRRRSRLPRAPRSRARARSRRARRR